MGLFEKGDGGKKTEEIIKDREKIKKQMATNLKKIGFDKNEIDEVIYIIDEAEAKIDIVKDFLIGTNINTEDPTPVMKNAIDEIRRLQSEMAVNIKMKIAQIQQQRQQGK